MHFRIWLNRLKML